MWKKTTTEPFFPGYLFLASGGDYSVIRSTKGVISLVMSCGVPATLSGDIIDRMKAKEHGGAFRLKEIRPMQYIAGDRLRIISGPFQGFEGTVDQMTGKEGRLYLLLQMIGRKTIINISDTDVALSDGR